MSAVTLVWFLGAALAALVGMMVVLIVARSLDGSEAESRRNFAEKMTGLAQKATRSSQSGSSSAWLSGAVAQTLTALADASKDTRGKPEDKDAAIAGRKQLKALMTGLAIAGGVLTLIVGIITGDGN